MGYRLSKSDDGPSVSAPCRYYVMKFTNYVKEWFIEGLYKKGLRIIENSTSTQRRRTFVLTALTGAIQSQIPQRKQRPWLGRTL